MKAVARNVADLVRFTLTVRYFREIPIHRWPAALPHLQAAWGNFGFAADLPYLRAVLDYATPARGPVLECGSGLTTLLLGLRLGHRVVWSLEHLEKWRRHVQTRLWWAGSGAHVLLAPLKPYGPFVWYEVPAALPREFGLVVCDGPPGTTAGGRYSLLPLLGDRLPKGTVILLDDAHRVDEQAILNRWEQEAGWRYTIKDGGTTAYAIVTV